jgi:hypothetical protein
MKKIMGAIWDLGLAVLFSRQLPRFFFHIFSIFFFLKYLIKNPQTTIPLTFLTHNISDIGGVMPNLLKNSLTVSNIHACQLNLDNRYLLVFNLAEYFNLVVLHVKLLLKSMVEIGLTIKLVSFFVE